MAKRKRTNW